MCAQLSAKGLRTKSEILDAAYHLFLERGIHATSIDDILLNSGKGKSQFYHYFKNKEDLVHSLLQAHLEEAKSDDMPYKMEVESWDDLEIWLKNLIEFYRSLGKARGCIIGMIGQETTPEEVLIRQDIQMILDLKIKSPRSFFVGLKAQDKLIDSTSPDIMANMLLSLIQGSALMVKVYQDEKIIDDNARCIVQALKSFDKTVA